MQLNLQSGPALVLISLGLSMFFAAAAATFRAARAARAPGTAWRYSLGERLAASLAAWVLVFGVLAVAEFGRSRGPWRWGVLAAAGGTAAIALWVLWQRFATCLIVGTDGFRFVGPLLVREGRWADLEDADWDAKKERLVLRLRTGTVTLAGELSGVRQVALAASERLKKKL